MYAPDRWKLRCARTAAKLRPFELEARVEAAGTPMWAGAVSRIECGSVRFSRERAVLFAKVLELADLALFSDIAGMAASHRAEVAWLADGKLPLASWLAAHPEHAVETSTPSQARPL